MARMMEIDGEMFRAVLLRKKIVSNPAYDWTKGYNQRDADGNRIPGSIQSETETYTQVYGPYARKVDAAGMRTRAIKNGYGESNVVGSHIERAVVTWEVLDD